MRTEVIYSEYNGAGEILPYYYFLKNKWADRMIFLHDSMYLYRPFTSAELEGEVCFHWDFPIEADVKLYKYISLLSKQIEITDEKWNGCFGGASIISYTTVKEIEDKYSFFTRLVSVIRNRKQREIFERLFGYIMYHEHKVTRPSNFGSIHDYPNCFVNDINFDKSSQLVSEQNYSTALLKIWRGR
jgi:hypothetical protein